VVYDALYRRRALKPFRFLHVLGKPRIDFIRMRRGAFVLSAVLVALGLAALVQMCRGRANLGVDFAGGTLVQFQAHAPFRLSDVRAALDRNRLADCELQEVPGERLLLVRARLAGEDIGASADRIAKVLSKELPDQRFTLQRQAEIGGSVSRDLQRAALVAVLVSLLGIVGYLAWRFDLVFGVAAAAATFHDVLAVLGVFYLLDREITLLVVTALLTLAGYSLTDTVVVFDRIRENRRRAGGGKDVGSVINRSVNEVLSRTLVTSGTVLLVLLALLFAGGLLLRDFALALTLGVLVGTYSSVLVASPIVYVWQRRNRRRRASIAAPVSGMAATEKPSGATRRRPPRRPAKAR
jgi:SecD/SecF fusion protein